MNLFKGLVEIGQSVRYRIFTSVRARKDHGSVVSRTRLEEFEGTVTVYDGGKVVVDSPRGRIEYDLRDGKIVAGRGSVDAPPLAADPE